MTIDSDLRDHLLRDVIDSHHIPRHDIAAMLGVTTGTAHKWYGYNGRNAIPEQKIRTLVAAYPTRYNQLPHVTAALQADP